MLVHLHSTRLTTSVIEYSKILAELNTTNIHVYTKLVYHFSFGNMSIHVSISVSSDK